MHRITSTKRYTSVYVRTASVAATVTTLIIITGAGRKFN
jgi:hypothetical protein